MSLIQHNDNKTTKNIVEKNVSLFIDWNKLHPNRELQHWRKVNEPIIYDALKVKERIEVLTNMLNDDFCIFCDDCDTVKCWGSIFPICEPILRKFTAIIEK
jgi:hypothetical protein